MTRILEFVSRRRALAGMAAVAPLSVVGGVGASVLLDGGRDPGDHATMVVAIRGRAVEATPALLATPVRDGGGSRRVGLTVRDGTGGRLSLAFDRPRPARGAGGWLDVSVSLDGDPVRSGPFDAVFDGTVEHLDARLCPGAESRLTVAWSAADGHRDERHGAVVAGCLRVRVGPDGCPGQQ